MFLSAGLKNQAHGAGKEKSMNVRKPTDYSVLFATLDALVAANLPQMELYCEIGRLVSGRPEKGAAVAAAEHLHSTYPDASGFSPRNLRRMRDFYRTYAETPEVLAEAMTIGWTQNVVILEAELTLQKRAWYIRAARQFGWTKLELADRITSSAHAKVALDLGTDVCYTEENSTAECVSDEEDPFRVPRQYLSESDGRLCDERPGEEGRIGGPVDRKSVV